MELRINIMSWFNTRILNYFLFFRNTKKSFQNLNKYLKDTLKYFKKFVSVAELKCAPFKTFDYQFRFLALHTIVHSILLSPLSVS